MFWQRLFSYLIFKQFLHIFYKFFVLIHLRPNRKPFQDWFLRTNFKLLENGTLTIRNYSLYTQGQTKLLNSIKNNQKRAIQKRTASKYRRIDDMTVILIMMMENKRKRKRRMNNEVRVKPHTNNDDGEKKQEETQNE